MEIGSPLFCGFIAVMCMLAYIGRSISYEARSLRHALSQLDETNARLQEICSLLRVVDVNVSHIRNPSQHNIGAYDDE